MSIDDPQLVREQYAREPIATDRSERLVEHVADLRREAGGRPVVTSFSSQNGEKTLRSHAGEVTVFVAT